MHFLKHSVRVHMILLSLVLILTGCANNTQQAPVQLHGKTVCDSYLILSMCVQDLYGDDTVDIVYFTDTKEVFMYQQGRQEAVATVMPFHRCAVPLDEGMQATTNRILKRSDLSISEELEITRDLIANYVAAKPAIDACNDGFDDKAAGVTEQDGEFSMYEAEWPVE